MGEIGEIFRVVVHYSMPNSSEALNVFFYELGGENETDANILDELETYFEGDWGNNWNDVSTDNTDMTLLEVDVVNVAGEVVRNLGQRVLDVSGGSGTDMVASGVAGLITAFTDVATSRGRKFIPGFADSLMVDGLWSATTTAVLAQLLIQYVFPIVLPSTGVLVAGVLSRSLEQFIEFNGLGQWTDVPAYQRRRKRDVGS